ncbi:NAD(P)H-flavin reductase [Agaribacter marinus]|uniref:NAD(P)H-flavin reductase n=1 Tax=Agaribacter marinus TaxID=1431249 RepID=A0AA37SZS5_9ALTE|nr:NAD(P)H-flavin reductase [Agaribacter marinus]GLR72441.1 NAD(P)H-flavin reductase [Agaribacter marinus]
MTLTEAKVVSIESLTPFVTKICLQPTHIAPFKAGQYLQVVMQENDKRPFSIANSPEAGEPLELHIGATPENAYAYEVLENAKNSGVLTLEVGLGDAYARESDAPMIIIAGGTGYSYAKSILHHTLAVEPGRDVCLYWGAKTLEDLYDHDELTALSNFNSKFTFIPVVESPNDSWQGKTGWVHKAVLDDHANLSQFHVYVAGRFEMAAAVKKDFLPKGIEPDTLFGDAFAYI